MSHAFGRVFSCLCRQGLTATPLADYYTAMPYSDKYLKSLEEYRLRRMEVVRLYDQEKKSFTEIGKIMKISRSAVHKLYHKGKGEE